ncbi:hypothetical protein QL285_011936 [Trifolium repens]|nr:hypothetical protein QL285_011936 [Trifolium repens]
MVHQQSNRIISCHFASFPAIEESLVTPELVESFTITSELFPSFADMGYEMLLVNSEPVLRLTSEDSDRDFVDEVMESRDITGTGGRLRGLTSETSSLFSSK